MKIPKTLRNPELRNKFTAGQYVNIPIQILYRFTAKLMVIPRPAFGKVVSVGDRLVGKHYRFAVDIRCRLGLIEVWEEWQLERIEQASVTQIEKHFPRGEPDYLSDESNSKTKRASSETGPEHFNAAAQICE
jgi:hypothetical protein